MPSSKRDKLRKLLNALEPDSPVVAISALKDKVSDSNQTLLAEFEKAYARLIELINEVITTSEAGDVEVASSLQTEIDSLGNRIIDIETRPVIDFSPQIQEVETKLLKLINGIDKKPEKDWSKKIKELTDLIETTQNELRNIGGGAQNQKISINGAVMSKRYADFNLIGSITATDDNSNKRVNITISPGGVTRIIAGTNITISPIGGTGDVTVNSSGGGGGSPGGSDTQVQFNDSDSFGGDAGLTYNKTTNQLKLDGLLGNSANASTINVTTGQMSDLASNITFNWLLSELQIGTTPTLGWSVFKLYDSLAAEVMNWDSGILFSTGGINSIDWENHTGNDNANIISIDYGNRTLLDNATAVSLDWNTRALRNNVAALSIDWQAHYLYANNGTDILVDFSNSSANGSYNFSGGILQGDGSGLTGVAAKVALVYANNLTTIRIDGENMILFDALGNNSVNFGAHELNETNSNTSVLNWDARFMNLPTGGAHLFDWSGSLPHTATLEVGSAGTWTTNMIDNAGTSSADFNSHVLYLANVISLNWDERILYAADGSTKVLDWHTDTTNTNSAAYWFDSGNSNRLTGDGAGLTGITAPQVAYTPTTSSDWSGDPTTVQEAIDRIAAVVAALNGGPIA